MQGKFKHTPQPSLALGVWQFMQISSSYSILVLNNIVTRYFSKIYSIAELLNLNANC